MKCLNNILLFFIVVSIAIPKEVFHFVIHIPATIHHFHQHNQEHGNIGFADFINLHSNDTKHRDNHHHDHDNLPFSHQHANDSSQLLTFLWSNTRLPINLAIYVFEDNRSIVQQYFRSSDFLPSIWQPPKIS